MATLNVSDLNRQGKVFVAANAAAGNFIAVASTQTNLNLYNPLGSGVKLILIEVGFSWTTVPGAVHNLGLATFTNGSALPTGITQIGVSADGSAAVPKGQATASIVLSAAPTARRWFGGAAWGSSVSVNPQILVDRVDGSIILIPGASVSIVGLTTTAVGVGSFVWAEVPA